MASSIIEGHGVGLTHLTYEDINMIRSRVMNINNFITLRRGVDGKTVVFEDILPAVVQHIKLEDIKGCGLLPDPNCLSIYNFTADIDTQRLINDIVTKCDWSHLGRLQGKYTARTAEAWAKDEIKEVFKWLLSTLPASTVTPVASERLLIENLVNEVEAQLFTDMGDLAPDRSEIIVVVGANHASALREIGFYCCDIARAKTNPEANIWDVKAVYNAPRWAGVGADEILVYVPALKFEVTTCENAPAIEELRDANYPRGTARISGSEFYGFQGLEFGKRDKTNSVVVVNAGVKYLKAPGIPEEPTDPEGKTNKK